MKTGHCVDQGPTALLPPAPPARSLCPGTVQLRVELEERKRAFSRFQLANTSSCQHLCHHRLSFWALREFSKARRSTSDDLHPGPGNLL